MLIDPVHRLLATGKLSSELCFFNLLENGLEIGPRRKTHGDQITTPQQGFRMNLLCFQFRKLLQAKAVVLEIAVGGERIDSRQFQKFIDSLLTQKPLECA